MSETLAAGRYRIERTLGFGGMAVVYLAHDEELHRRVAIKVLAEHLGSTVGDLISRIQCVPPPRPPDKGKHKGKGKK